MRVTPDSISSALLFTFILVSCSTSEESRYRDTGMLERPPILVVEKKAGEQLETDDSAVSSKENAKTGLSAEVYMTMSPPLLIIKQPFDRAWDTLGHALKQNYIKISDREHDKGLYYVTYDPDRQEYEDSNIFGKITSFLKDEYDEETYRLIVDKNDSETQISAEMVEDTEKSSLSANQDGYYDKKPTDGAEKLLRSLYKILRDDLVEK